MIDIICIVDRSGSMQSMWSDAVGAFNAFIQDQKGVPGEARVTLVLFNTQAQTVFEQRPLLEVGELTEKGYVPGGATALYDAIGATLKDKDLSDKGIVMILTDGMENASKKYTKEQAMEIVEGLKAQGWEVHYTGAHEEAFAEGRSISATSISHTSHDGAGMKSAFMNYTMAATDYRARNTSVGDNEESST